MALVGIQCGDAVIQDIKALIVVMGIFLVARQYLRPLLAPLTGVAVFDGWVKTWVAITVVAFLVPNYWLAMALIAAALVTLPAPGADARIATYFGVMCAVPGLNGDVPFPGLNYLMELDYTRLLTLALLLPVGIRLFRSGGFRGKWEISDKAMALSVLLAVALGVRDTTFTSALRDTVELLLSVTIPYFVLTRSIKTRQQFDACLALFLAGMVVIAGIAMFETVRHWKVYEAVTELFRERSFRYENRGGFNRASATFGTPIALGFALTLALGVLMYLRQLLPRPRAGVVLLLVIGGGLFASVSRGPWLGAALLIGVFLFLGRGGLRKVVQLGFAGVLVLALLAMTPFGKNVVELLPFIGDTRSDTVDYRVDLIKAARKTFSRNPWFGTTDPLRYPEMQAMIQGQGIIDLVNSYIQVGLYNGGVGLAIFLLSVAWPLRPIYRQLKGRSPLPLLPAEACKTLIACQVGTLFIIGTVSSVSFIPALMWASTALCVAFLRSGGQWT